MKLAFSGDARYTSFDGGYDRYVKTSKTRKPVDKKDYKRVVRMYCEMLAKTLESEGIVDLPCDMGAIAAVMIKRKPIFMGKKFVGYGKKDWKNGGAYDDSRKAFGIAFLPRHINGNMRCYGFVANRKLFKKMKELSDSFICPWIPMTFTDEMI